MKIDILKKYFQSWIDIDTETVKATFSENAVYSECYGPEYHGLSQILKWFADWNQKGKVLEWTVGRSIESESTVVAVWYFKCEYNGEIDGFDGVTVADFDDNMKITKLCEYQSKSDHYFPYD